MYLSGKEALLRVSIGVVAQMPKRVSRTMTMKEVIEIIKESPLFELLTFREKSEAITHALEAAGTKGMQEDIRDKVGEVYISLN